MLPPSSSSSSPSSSSLRTVLLIALFVLLVLSPVPCCGVGKKKLSEADLQELEDQWFEDEADDPDDLSHWRKGPDGQRVPPKHTKSEMAFVALHKPITKDETGKWGGQMADILVSGGVDVKAYPVEAGKVLFVADKGFSDMLKVQRFILKQEKVVDFEWNQKKSYPKRGKEEEEEEEEEPLDLSSGNIQDIIARAQAKSQPSPLKRRKEKDRKGGKPVVVDQSLGGAGAPIPADLPEDE